MSLNNQDENNQSFDADAFSEEQENFDSDPAVVAATEASSSTKSKGGWWILLVGIIGTGAYLGYRYYLVPHGTTLASIEASLLPAQHADNPSATAQNPSVPAIAQNTAAVPTAANANANGSATQADTSKLDRQAHKNAQFEHLRAALFDNNTPTKTTVAVPPPAPSANKQATTSITTAAATTTVKSEPKSILPAAATVAPAVTAATAHPAEQPAPVGDTTQAAQLSERLEINIHQIQHLEEVLQGITQTISKLNTDISAMDNRLLALSNSTGNLSADMGNMKHEMSSVKRVLGEEGVLDMHVPPPPSHTYLKASQVASARPKTIIPAYVVHAIIPGRAWLKANNGQIMTVTEGDTLGDYGKVLVIDAASGMVLTSSGNTFQ